MPVFGLDELEVVSWLFHPEWGDLLGLGHLGVGMERFSIKSLVELARILGVELSFSHHAKVTVALRVLGGFRWVMLVLIQMRGSLVRILLLRRNVLEIIRAFEHICAHLSSARVLVQHLLFSSLASFDIFVDNLQLPFSLVGNSEARDARSVHLRRSLVVYIRLGN